MIWIVGGGPKSHQLCQKLKQLQKAYKLTTITDYKRDMPLSYTSKALQAPMSKEEMQQFIQKEHIQLVIDHSYGEGTLFSRQLMAVCEENKLEYIRYEEATFLDEIDDSNIRVITEIEEVHETLSHCSTPIFMDLNRKVKKEVAALNLTSCIYREDLIDFQIENVRSIFERNHVKMVLAHENQDLPLYRAACHKLDIPLIVIKRNKMKYSKRCYQLEALEEYLL